ncbi:TonB-dependent receptor [Chitinophaga sp. 30R24]|uniref:TonB-dependent receptor n=1 Tax=Chitinophaga sp. 30R24 TaxID=3248838 RepID=UPI003B915A56
MKRMLSLFLLLFTQFVYSQTNPITGTVVNDKTGQPLEGITVRLLPAGSVAVTNAQGKFIFKSTTETGNNLQCSGMGYQNSTLTLEALRQQHGVFSLTPEAITLNAITVAGHTTDPYKPISKIDIAMRGVNNSQEVLRIVPGLFIGQHQGGGKAEQIFLRGFDCDHGTDISLQVDGMPVNMVSHAHGQGFADSHFIIPETIEAVNFKKGPYYAEKGDFATTGYVDFHTRNMLPQNEIKLEGGMFNTYRALGMFNLLSKKAREKQQSWYVATEYRYSDSYFDNPQHFNRFNFFTKYNGKLSDHTSLIFTASTFYSKWNASGQIPDRAVANGDIGFYGALDPNEGGVTSRTNANVELLTSLRNGDLIKNQFFYTYYTFDLHTNFTFFLVDSINGDEIRQREKRNLFGYKGSYEHTDNIGSVKLLTTAGVQVRADATNNTELAHTKDRYTLLDDIKLGDITELNAGAYISETLLLNGHFTLNAGLRFDQFFYRYNNKLAGDTTLPGAGIYKAHDQVVSPKLSLYYQVNTNTEFYLSTGKGFHSNDARGVVARNGVEVLPAAYGADLGTIFKPARNLLVNAALWYIYLQQEFVYGGDGGAVEFSGPTRRTGVDLSARYQPIPAIYIDADVNYAHGRSVGSPKGADYIPLAPEWSSTGGITYVLKNGLNGSLRYRYLADRPANEDYSLTASGYCVTDFILNYTKPKYEIGFTINNLLNTKWKETQFDTETRLKGETHSVDEICFTPGTPFAAKISFALFF